MFSKLSTRAFVMGSYNRDEADKRIKLLTERFGMISALTKGVRKETSKLRYSLSQYALVEVEMVDSKSGWRTTGAELLETPTEKLGPGLDRVYIKVLSIMEKLVYGEEHDPELFGVIEKYLQFIYQNNIEQEQYKAVELHWLAAVLLVLGYLNLDQLDISIGIPLKELSIQSINNLIGEEQLLAQALRESLEQTQI